ncbi:MAG: LPS export ABC transporter periplasmic protein LptC [Spirochaetia bacterium]
MHRIKGINPVSPPRETTSKKDKPLFSPTPQHTIALLICTALLLLAPRCSFDYRDTRLSESLSDDVPDSVFSEYIHTSVRKGKPAFEVAAETSEIFHNNNEALLSEVSFREFDSEEQVVSEGVANNAIVFTQSDNVELTGAISFTHRPEDFDIEAEYLYWNNEERSLESRQEEIVSIRRKGGSTISGRGFSSSGAYRRVQFDGEVEGNYAEADEEEKEGENGSTSSFSFSGDSTSIEMSEGSRRTILSGNARISSDDIHITADTIEMYGEDFHLVRCEGNVETEDSKRGIELSSEKLFYDREKDILRVEGYNEMIDFTNELVAKSGYLEYRGEEDTTVFQIGVRILKATEDTKMVSRSEFGRYNRENSQLTLSGMPVVRWEEDTYRATRIIINLESDEIRLEGDVEGEITSEKEEANEREEDQ